MDFKRFRALMQSHVAAILERHKTLFTVGVDKDGLWTTYLDSFPLGTNEIFRERREHDCSCCRSFIRSFGNVVAITDENQVVTIWDFETNDTTYQPVVSALSAFVRAATIQDVFVTKESAFGTDHNFEQTGDGIVRTWHHFRIELPAAFVPRSSKSVPSIMGALRDVRNVFARSLEEISEDAVETVLDLISQKSLYKGEEWEGSLRKFLFHLKEFRDLSRLYREAYCWRVSVEIGGAIGKIKNHSIGVLLTDISEGMDLDVAVKRYEKIVAPTNYKRPKAVFTKRMVEQAQETLAGLGLLGSLGRRFATIEDITVNNILFANKDALKQMGGVFGELKGSVPVNPRQFDRVEEVPVGQFIEQVLPRTTGVEIFLEGRLSGNLVSVIAPQDKDVPTMFKWGNGFSWAYSGNIADSMKERVKAAGGNVEGVLRFSLQWNDNGDNQNDFDAHCWEPGGNHIWFKNKGLRHASSGMLDVDIIHPDRGQVAVENITWTRQDAMSPGTYRLAVHNYTHRGGRSGFSAEIECGGQIHSYEHPRELRAAETVLVAVVEFNGSGQFSIIDNLPSSLSSKQIWGLGTNQFHPVSVCMFSPNYWDEQQGIGHRHYLFIMKGCINDTQPNGFFNEFLREDLMPHKRVFEALGGKMRVDSCETQLSGLGFSSTKKNAVICRVTGHVTRTMKIVF